MQYEPSAKINQVETTTNFGHGQGHHDPPLGMVKVVSKEKMKEIRDHLRRWSAAWNPDILRDYEHKIL